MHIPLKILGREKIKEGPWPHVRNIGTKGSLLLIDNQRVTSVELRNLKCVTVRQKLGTRTLSLSNSLTLSQSHSLSFTLVILNNFCCHVYAQKSLSHFLTLSMSRSHSFTLSFTHSPHAEQLLLSCLCSKVAV